MKLIHAAKYVWSALNDRYLGIETSDRTREVDTVKGFPFARADYAPARRHLDAVIYQAADYYNLRRMVRKLDVGPSDVFVDIGCGKGRALCLLARESLRRVIGIEVSPALCRVARQNAGTMRGKRTPIEVREGDAAAADYSTGTIYFLYHPFGEATMADVLAGIKRTLLTDPREITIIYYNAALAAQLQATPWLTQGVGFTTLTGFPVAVFTNRVAPESMAA